MYSKPLLLYDWPLSLRASFVSLLLIIVQTIPWEVLF
jgi:hypothetical protein